MVGSVTVVSVVVVVVRRRKVAVPAAAAAAAEEPPHSINIEMGVIPLGCRDMVHVVRALKYSL